MNALSSGSFGMSTAAAAHVELPAVVRAAQPALLVPAEEEGAMGTVGGEEADLPLRGLPDTAGRGRAAGRQLPAPRRLALLRPQRGVRAALRVPRLEVRRERPLRRHAERAGGEQLQGQGAGARLSLPRRQRRDLDLHGPARDAAALPGLRDQHAAGRAGLPAAHDAGGVQLGAGARGRHRFLPHRLRARQAHARQQAARHLPPGQAAAARGAAHRLRRVLLGPAALGRRGPLLAPHHPVHPAVLHDDRRQRSPHRLGARLGAARRPLQPAVRDARRGSTAR